MSETIAAAAIVVCGIIVPITATIALLGISHNLECLGAEIRNSVAAHEQRTSESLYRLAETTDRKTGILAQAAYQQMDAIKAIAKLTESIAMSGA